ncbi:hypothetical protein N431DRAFT_562967 [Stipitochalara longipes BDJ]|nr:hypothetical protein N431DRAFT_562967 [Stipitochalara longipes BDJ]
MAAAVIPAAFELSEIAATGGKTIFEDPSREMPDDLDIRDLQSEVQSPAETYQKPEVEAAILRRASAKKEKLERRESTATLKQEQRLHKKNMKRERKQTRKMLRELTKGSELWFVDDDESQNQGVLMRIMANKREPKSPMAPLKTAQLSHPVSSPNFKAATLTVTHPYLSQPFLPKSASKPPALKELPKIPIVIRAKNTKTTLILTRTIAIIRIGMIRLSPRPRLRRVYKPRRPAVLGEGIDIACKTTHREVTVLVDPSPHIATTDYPAVVDSKHAPDGSAGKGVTGDVAVNVEAGECGGCEGEEG